MVIIHIDEAWGVNYHRLITPFMLIERKYGIPMYWIEMLTELKNIHLDKVDTLVVSRKLSVTNHFEFKKMLVNNGIKLILDLDDYWELNEGNPAKAIYDTYVGPDCVETIKIADVIWVASRYLGKQARKINPTAEIVFINNAIDVEDVQWAKFTKKKSKELRFGYTGATSHLEELRSIGYDFKYEYTTCLDIKEFKELLNPNKTFGWYNIWSYAKAYESIDVSLAPLGKNKFNWCKSDLKVTEAAFTKTAIIATNTKPYSLSIKDGETGILCNNPKDWKEAVKGLTKAKAKQLGENLYEDLRDHPDYDISAINEIRVKYLK